MDLFKNKVYEVLKEVPRGKVTTYGAIAEKLGKKCLSRAVGNALHQNTDKYCIPCYRVVSSKGRLSKNYALGGIEEQRRLLEEDGIEVVDCKVDLDKFGV
ncbi:MAG: Methylated-DNA--protein-cysteine methyltransferase [Firmicutes bacterium ADurb.Bin300]|nr:MAG: Methylated-DNA--protein-cysteine methyltransferase [Firmicutes bacterium ADurb.Bin300]